MNKQIIFVDSSVQDYQSLIKDIDRAEIVILDENFSAIDEITKVLADRKDIESVHILSHGSSGSLKLGSDTLNNQTLDEFSDRIKQWGKALTENGDILLYGCDVGAEETGLQFVQKLNQLTGADIAASDNKTGDRALGGDWDLEVKVGEIESSLFISKPAQTTYNGILGIQLVKDINPGPSGSSPGSFTIFNNTLYFGAYDNTRASEFWKSDGTAAGTVLVKDIRAGGSSDADRFFNFNGILFFVANNGFTGMELWKSDGTAAGTVLVKDINPFSNNTSDPQKFTNINGTLFFLANDGTNGQELWKTDGTTAGTVLFKDINPGAGSSINGSAFTEIGGIMYFGANDGTNGTELWKSDGTTAGTVLVKDINPGSGSSSLSSLTNVNGTLYFTADNGINGYELWKSDGTTAGTVLVKDINPGSGDSLPLYLTNFNGTLFFQANDGINGIELWKSDGTTAGTVLLKDINPGSGDSSFLEFTNFNNTLYFSANNGINGYELWKSDGTAAGTVLLKDINPGSGDSWPRRFTNFNSTLFFMAYDDINGYELWTSDGTETGTVLFKNINPGSGHSLPDQFINFNGNLYFTADNGINGVEWFKLTPSQVTSVSATTANGSYGVGQTINITVTFDDPIVVDTTGGIPRLQLAIGANQYATYASGSGTNTLTFSYVVQAGDASTDLQYVATNSLELNGGTIKGHGEDAILTLPSLASPQSLGGSKNLVIETIAPTVTSITSTTPDGTYTAGQAIPINVQFSEIVDVTGTPQLTLATGGAGTVLNYAGGSGTNTLTFNYTVATGDTSADLDYLSTAALSLNGGTIKDAATNAADLTLAAPGAANSLGASKALVIDALIPTVTGITSTTTDGSYTVGQVIPITVQFNEIVNVTGTPQLTLATGGAGTVVNYASGSGTDTLTFNYTVAAGDTSADLDYLSTAALSLNGGTIADSANNNADLTLSSPGATNSLGANKALVIDAVIPTVTNITSTTSDGTYTVGQVIPITAEFSEAVNITGTPQLTLATGGAGTALNYASGSGSNTLTFNYTVATGDASADLDYLSTAALALNGGTIADSANNNADVTLPSPAATNSLGANKALVIDTIVPTVTNITSTTSDGTYTVGQVIPITVEFNEIVNVTGTPQLTLATGGAGKVLNYTSGSGTKTLTFNYTAAAGDTSADLDYLSNSALALNGGTIADTAGNNATLTLPAPAGANSLAANKNIAIDTTPLTVTINQDPGQPDPTAGSTINFAAVFSKPVTGFDSSDITIGGTAGATGATVTQVGGTGTIYNIAVAGMSAIGTVTATINAGRATDTAGNSNTASSSTDNQVNYDNTRPTSTGINRVNPDINNSPTVNYTANFSENVTGVDASDFTLATSGGVTGASIASVTPVNGSNYTVNVNTGSGDGTLQLNLTDDDSIQNTLLVPIGGAGANNGNATGQIYTLDKTVPTLSNVTSTNADGTYGIGQVIALPLTFSEVVQVTGTPKLNLNNGGFATYAAGNNTNALTFNYNVAAGESTADLDYASTTALDLSSGTIQDLATNNANLTLAAPGAAGSVGANKNILIDATAAAITNITSSLADGNYTIGQVVPIAVSFSESVSVTGSPNLILNNGGTATYASGSGTNTVTFNYIVAAGQNTPDLDQASVSALSLNGGTIKDVANNNATLTVPAPGAANSLGANKNIAIDTIVPAISDITSTLADGSYTVAQVVPITIAFSESVNVTGVPKLALNNGSNASYANGSGSNLLTFNYTVAAGQNIADLDYANALALSLNGGTIKDASNNNAALILPTAGATNSLGANKNIAIDTTTPAIASVTSTLANGSYTVGQVVPIAVTFNESVNITGAPTLALNNGGSATYASGSGSNSQTFNYTIAAGQNTADLDYANATALALNGGTIQDLASNNAALSLVTPGALNSLGANKAIAIDTIAPTISNTTSTLPNGSYPIGQVVPIAIGFSENVNVTGTPILALNNGGNAIYASGSGMNTLTFNHTVAAGQNTADLDYASANALSLNGGTIKDTASNNASLTLAAPGAANSLGTNKAIAIDATVPTISSVTSTLANGTYTVGQVVPITLAFNESVSITGTPILDLNNGGTADYVSGSGSSSLTFNYTVTANQSTADLDYANANALSVNGGTIKDLSNNNANLTLPAPGAANSLSGNKDIEISDPVTSNPVSTPSSTTANIRLDGVNDYVKIAKESTFDITQAITVEGWFKVDKWTKPWQAIITKGDSAWRISRAGQGNSLEFAIGSGSSTKYVQGITEVNDGRWHHVAAVYDGSVMKLYIDGANDGQKTAKGSIPTNNYDVWIGANAQEAGRNFAGQLDEFRVWNVVRSQSDIQANMSRSIDPNSSGLLAYWKFDEGTGTTAADARGGDNNGTLIDGTSWKNSSPLAQSPLAQSNPTSPGVDTPTIDPNENKSMAYGIDRALQLMIAKARTEQSIYVPVFNGFLPANITDPLLEIKNQLSEALDNKVDLSVSEIRETFKAGLPQGFTFDDTAFQSTDNSLQLRLKGTRTFDIDVNFTDLKISPVVSGKTSDVVNFTTASDNQISNGGRRTVNYDLSFAVGNIGGTSLYIDTQKTSLKTSFEDVLKDGQNFKAINGFIPVDFKSEKTDTQATQINGSYTLNLLDPDKNSKLTTPEFLNATQQKTQLTDSFLTADGTLNLKGEIKPLLGLPSIQYNLFSDLPNVDYINGKSIINANPSFLTLNNIKLDLGDFISNFAKPVFGNISRVLAPVRPILDFLNTDTKIFGEVGLVGTFDADRDGKVTPLDLVKKLAPGKVQKYVKFIDTVNQLDRISRLVDEAINSGDNVAIDLAPYEFYKPDTDESKSTDFSLDFSKKPEEIKKQYTEFKELQNKLKLQEKLNTKSDMIAQKGRASGGVQNQIKSKGGSGTKKEELAAKLVGALDNFDLPIFTDPTSVGKLLAGQDIPLMTYKLPELEFGTSIEAPFRLWGVLKGGLRGDLNANLRSIPIGYDTYGIRTWAKTGNDSDLLNGFYMSTNANADGTGANLPELTLKATIGAFAALDVFVAEAGVIGGIEGTAELNLMEPKGSPIDGKLRGEDLAKIFTSPADVINLQGGIKAFFDAYYETLFTSRKTARLASFPIYNFRVGAKSGTAQDGYITGAWVFFDANFNGIQDEGESNSMTFPDGSFELQVDVDKFDTNKNGKLDPTEGKVVLISGQDISTGLTLDTPLSSVYDSKMVTPLTTLVAQLAQEGMDVTQAQTQVKAALGLSADVDLATYNPLEQLANNDPQGLAFYAAAIQVQNTIVQTAKFIDGASNLSVAQLAGAPIAIIAAQLKTGTPVDFGKVETILAIVQDAITKAAQTEPTINPSQLAAAAAAAAQIVALGNQMVKDLVASGRPIKEIALEITKLQAVSVGQIAVGLSKLAAGIVTVEQFLAQNTKETILSRMAQAQVNDPTFRPSLETTASENALVPEEPDSSNINPVTQIETTTSENAFVPFKPNSNNISPVTEVGTSASTAIEINTPKTSLIDRGSQTNLPQNQLVDGNYLLTDGDDNQIPPAAFSQPIFGLSGNDNLIGSDNNDTIHGNKGADAINGGNGNDNLFGGKQSDRLSGGKGEDFLSGNNENDTLTGGNGNDLIRGGKENDVLIGGKGDDELWGDKGFDVLTGGAGKDNFVLEFAATNPAFADVILDFTLEDKIKLVGATFSQLTFESVNVILDGATAVASTAIKSGNNYLGVVYNVNPTALNSSSFL